MSEQDVTVQVDDDGKDVDTNVNNDNEPVDNGDTSVDTQQSEDTNTTNNENQEGDADNQQEDNKPSADEKATEIIKEARDTEGQVKETLKAKDIDFDALSDEYLENGQLSDKTYETLDKAGFPKALVDAYIAGVEAKSEQVKTSILNSVGGQEEYNKIASYIQSKGNACVDAFNNLLDLGNVSSITMFLNGLKAEMTLNHGTSGRTILGRQGVVNKGGFATEAEMLKAMSDPRYKTDSNYRDQVVSKLKNSNLFSYNK